MRIGAAHALVVVLALSLACGGGGFFRQYEYEEETYLSLDGTATVYVNASVPALNVLRGSRFDKNPDVTPDKASIAAFFDAPGTRVTRVTFSHRQGRLYLHVRMDVDDVRQLGRTKPFDWSTYAFSASGDLMVYQQGVGGTAVHEPAGTWSGDELVAFRMHIPSKVAYHNAGADNLKRGNILVWEQPLAERLQGAPLELEARMEKQSILYRTLWLFGGTILAVALLFGLILWWIRRLGRIGRVGEVGRVGPVGKAS